MRRPRAAGVLVALGLVAALAGPAAHPAGAGTDAVSCTRVSGAARVTPGFRATSTAQTLTVNTFRIAGCDGTTAAAATASGTLTGTTTACPLAPADRLKGAFQIDWKSGSVSYLKTARVQSTKNAADPFEVRLAGVVTGGLHTGGNLLVVLHLVPKHGDCASGVTAVALTNVGALTIGGPYANCDAVDATASASPGLSTTAAPQTVHFSTFTISGCQAADTAPGAHVIGALQGASVSCPVAKGERLFGMLEVDWDNHFVSIIKRAHLNSTKNPADPFELTLHGVIARGADAGATLAVVVHMEPTAGDCAGGVTAFALTNVGPLTVV